MIRVILIATFTTLPHYQITTFFMHEIRTERILLRQFRDSDLEPLVAMGQDPIVMKYFVQLMSPEESQAMMERMKRNWIKNTFGVFALEIPGVHEFAGFVGFTYPTWEAEFTPCVEILWRLIPSVHNKGYCTEAARACLDWGFNEKGFTEVYSFAYPGNVASWKVMEKIGMKRIGEFEHPMVQEGHELRRHLLYKITNSTNE